MDSYPSIEPNSRNPDLKFRDVQFNPYQSPITVSSGVEYLGTISATAELEGYTPTKMYYRVARIGPRILLGQRCGFLHSPHINARNQASETLWCTNCWADPSGTGRGTLIVPFYLYYRHYEDHVLAHLPACVSCGKKFQVWEADETLKDGYTYLFSAYKNDTLQGQVEFLLKNIKNE